MRLLAAEARERFRADMGVSIRHKIRKTVD